MEEPDNLAWLSQFQAQCGVISRQQALDAGFTDKAIEWRLHSGHWQLLHRRVYATFTGVLSRQARLWAAVLKVGPDAVLSHETAAEIHQLTDNLRSRIHISVPAEQHPARREAIRGVVIHRRRGLVAEWQPAWQLPRTSVEDTVLDLVGAARSFDDAYGWISAAVGRRLTTPEMLVKALSARSRMRWRDWVAAALEDAAEGVHSPLERHYVRGVEQAHGPPRSARSCAGAAGPGPSARAAPRARPPGRCDEPGTNQPRKTVPAWEDRASPGRPCQPGRRGRLRGVRRA
jgi:hypothetical protein